MSLGTQFRNLNRQASAFRQDLFGTKADGTKVSIDPRGFSAMARDLSRMGGAPIENVILSEAGAIIGRCIQMTPRGNRERIERSLNFRNRTLWDNGDPDDPKKRGSFVAGFGKR